VTRGLYVAGILIGLLSGGCAGVTNRPTQEPAAAEPPSPAAPVETAQPPPATKAPETAPAVAATPAPPAAPPSVAAAQPPVTTAAAPAAASKPQVATAKPPAAPAAKPPTVKAAAPPSTASIPAVAATVPATAKPPAPVTAPTPSSAKPLDLASLEKRLRETKAIGLMTKISLKNQVDDLLDKFRAYYRKQTNTSLAQLRRPYDMLLLKVLSLLQDSDPTLARDIVTSREAIWGILADPEKFTKANLMAGATP